MISNFLAELKEKGWKQKDLAEKLEITTAHINGLVKGKNCSVELIVKIAELFNVTTDEVLGRRPARTITPVEKLLLESTAGDENLARTALRSVQGEKLLREEKGKGGGQMAA